MTILSDRQIIERCQGDIPMISPFIPHAVKVNEAGNKALSFGTSSFGYDVRLADEFVVFTNTHSAFIDPKRLDPTSLSSINIQTSDDGDKYVIIPPNGYLLGKTVEEFKIPRDIMVVCVGKSTYARAGLIVNVTPIEPGFIGRIVIEISNSTNLPARIYVNEGVSQFLFFQGSEECDVSYSDRNGKYNFQTGLQLPLV